jgi:hypothetical protein
MVSVLDFLKETKQKKNKKSSINSIFFLATVHTVLRPDVANSYAGKWEMRFLVPNLQDKRLWAVIGKAGRLPFPGQ